MGWRMSLLTASIKFQPWLICDRTDNESPISSNEIMQVKVTLHKTTVIMYSLETWVQEHLDTNNNESVWPITNSNLNLHCRNTLQLSLRWNSNPGEISIHIAKTPREPHKEENYETELTGRKNAYLTFPLTASEITYATGKKSNGRGKNRLLMSSRVSVITYFTFTPLHSSKPFASSKPEQHLQLQRWAGVLELKILAAFWIGFLTTFTFPHCYKIMHEIYWELFHYDKHAKQCGSRSKNKSLSFHSMIQIYCGLKHIHKSHE